MAEFRQNTGYDKLVASSGEWDESKHPRDDDGKFTSGGGGGKSGGKSQKFKLTYKVLTEDELNNEGADSKGWGYIDDYVDGTSVDDLEYDATNDFEDNWEYGSLEDAKGNPLELGGKKKIGEWSEDADGSYEQWVTYTDSNGYKIYLIQRAEPQEDEEDE